MQNIGVELMENEYKKNRFGVSIKKLKLVWKILRSVSADKIVLSFLISLIIVAIALIIIEPNINTISDSLWYCFAVISTIGFGDIVPVTLIGRILSVYLGINSMFVVALVPGVLVSYFLEIQKIKVNESTSDFLEKLEKLDQLSKEELAEISSKIKARKYKI